MQKIKIITDSACDISKEMERDLDILVLSFPITVDDKSYMERIDFTPAEFYDILLSSPRIPVTSQITNLRFCEVYEKLFDEGYTEVVYVSINSKGSSTRDAAMMAIDMFYDARPEAKGIMNIHVVDSLNYTLAYGYPVIQAALKAQKGADIKEILAYLEDWFASVEIYFAPYTLEFVKKSGRVSCAAAFVGELIGLRPIISIIDGETKIVEKVRGDKSIIPALIKHAQKSRIPETPYCTVCGMIKEHGEELVVQATKKLGQPPELNGDVGAAIAINAGPKVVALIIKGPRRDAK